MPTDTIHTPSAYLKQVSPATGDAFRALRDAVSTGPLDAVTCELILIGGFAVSGYETALKVHGLRLLRQGVQKQALQQAVLVMLGATLPMLPVTQALRWIDDIAQQHALDSSPDAPTHARSTP